MKRFKVIRLLLFIPVALQAQAIGQVPFGARVFSTGFPDTEKYWGDDGPNPIPKPQSFDFTFPHIRKIHTFHDRTCRYRQVLLYL